MDMSCARYRLIAGTLERPPTRLQYWFSEDLEPRFSEIKLRDQSGEVIAIGSVDATNHALLSLRVPAGLGDGAYIVELRPAFASDGHVIAESRVFFVGEEVGGVTGSAADDRALPLEVIWRAGLNLANFLFFGASLLYAIRFAAGLGQSSASARGMLPDRVMRRLRNCLAAAVALALFFNLVALLQQSMIFFNTDALQVIQQGLWSVVLIGSRFGDVWIFRTGAADFLRSLDIRCGVLSRVDAAAIGRHLAGNALAGRAVHRLDDGDQPRGRVDADALAGYRGRLAPRAGGRVLDWRRAGADAAAACGAGAHG